MSMFPIFECSCPPDDCEALVGRYLEAGDRGAGDALLRVVEGLVLQIVGRRFGPGREADRDDCAQEVRHRLVSRLARWQRRAPFCHWASVVIARQAIDYRDWGGSAPGTPVDLPPDLPAPRGASADLRECIEAHAARFPPELRAVYDLKLEELPHAEIAARLGVGIATVQNRLRTIRELLSPCLERR